MESKVCNFFINVDWSLINSISLIDRFDASWSAIERKEGQSLEQLKSIATIRSVGASTRIEGSKMSDREVDELLKNLDIANLEDRDAQEVIGYFETLDLISENFNDIEINTGDIKNLHARLLKYSQKDYWHKGDYKQHSNAVEANFPDGSKHIIFETTEAGFATSDAMNNLFDWFAKDQLTPALVKCAVFTYEFLSIHPFQDGNGRLSRLISSLLLLKSGYNWIQYVSFEHEVENRKTEYYRALRNCQAQRPNENISEWINFFFDALQNVQVQLMQKLNESGIETQLSPRDKAIMTLIESRPGIRSGEIANKLSIPSPTVKRILAELQNKGLIERHGVGRGTNYTLN